MTDEQFNKLPKYAQDELRNLTMRLKEEREFTERLTSSEPSLISWQRLVDGKLVENYLPDRTAIKFKSESGFFEAQLRNGMLEVYSNNSIHIIPNVSNSIKVAIVD